MQGKLNVCIVKTAGFGDTQDHWLQDIEAKCGGKVFNSFDSIIKVKENELGICDKVEITSTTSTFIKDGVDEDYIGNLTSILTQVETDFEREIVENRIARLTSGIASIKVGGITDIEQRERRERVDDAVNAATLARKQGVVCGGGVALKDIWWKTLPLHDKMDGKIYFDAILAPIKQILSNSGEPMKNLAYVKSKGEGYNAVSRKYQNLRFHGIIDPVGVSINAVESAFSIAILLLTTDCAIIAPQE
jgi:chaperonin GroEL